MRGRGKNKRRKAKARVVTSKSTLNSLMKSMKLEWSAKASSFIRIHK